MRLSSFLSVFALGFGLVTVSGCAADSEQNPDDQTTEDPGEQSDDVVSGKKFHYSPIGAQVFWKPGCGVRPPDGHVCEMGLFVKYTRAYIDLKVTKTAKFDAATNTLTVTVDTWSTSKTHPLVMVALMPQEERIENIAGVGMGMRFHARVVDWKGKQLSTSEIYEIPAP